MLDPIKWKILESAKIVFIECDPYDRQFVLQEIIKYSKCQSIYYGNLGYENIQQVNCDLVWRMESTRYFNNPNKITASLVEYSNDCPDHEAVFILDGVEEIDLVKIHELRNYHFGRFSPRLVLLNSYNIVPLGLYPIVPNIKYEIPNISQLESFIRTKDISQETVPAIAQAAFGLPIGEVEMLLDKELDVKLVREYKTGKLAKQGLKILPPPDVEAKGLESLDQDLNKIKCLFSKEAKARGLRPPRAVCFVGLPGTGKSLVVKNMSKKLGIPAVAVDWNELIESDIGRSLAKLQFVLDVADKIGQCILSFDEFEKAFSGWASGYGGGVLTKMAGKLLTWMQDHQTPVIMVATINRLSMLSPEIKRRFEYKWFFDSDLHFGAMWDIFKIHLEKHFPGYQEKISNEQWFEIFEYYQGCSPAEIGGAISRTHQEIFYADKHRNLSAADLITEIIVERGRFQAAIHNKDTSNALAEIRNQSEGLRPVRGKDNSQFHIPQRSLLEPRVEDQILQNERFNS